MSYRIRKAEVNDCERALELIHELAVFEKAPNEVEVNLQQFIKDGFSENSIYFMFVAEEDGNIVGIAICYEKYSTWKGRSIYLEDLIVTENKRGQGIGKALFERVLLEAKRRESGRMEWQVLDWNVDAIKFYESYGANIDSSWLNGSFRKEKLQEFKG